MGSRITKSWRRIALLAAFAGGLVLASGAAQARQHLDQRLTSSSNAGVSGRVRVVLRNGGNGRFVLMLRGLAPDQTYDVLVGNVKVGTLQTTGGGGGAVRFRTRPTGNDLMLGFDPRGALLTIRNAAGEDVLTGVISAGSTGPSDKVICCVPDDSGAECEDRTADECSARGGTVAAATSCLPNPCEGAPPVQTDIVCCVPDDSGPECEDRTAAQCAAQGGVVVAASSCTPNPCAATPPADPDIRCCLPDDSGTECEDRTPAQCAAQGGTDLGAGSCTPNPCAGATSSSSGDDSGGGHHGGRDGGGGGGGGGGGTYYGGGHN